MNFDRIHAHLGNPASPTGHQIETAERLMEHATSTESGCLEWTGNRNNCGYGQIRVGGKMWQTHRLAWVLHFGEIPEGLVVMHMCDNPACIDIDHLLLGTQRANVLDRQNKGRGVVPAHQRRRES